MKGLLLRYLGSLLIFVLANPAYAISCLQPSAEQAYEKAETVILVQPTTSSDEIAEIPSQESVIKRKKELPIKVLRVWKNSGNLPHTIVLFPNLYNEYPRLLRTPNPIYYVLYLSEKDKEGHYEIDPCSRYVSIEPKNSDLVFLLSKESHFAKITNQ